MSKVTLVYSTEQGKDIKGVTVGTSLEQETLRKESVDLIVTSPPFALEHPKRYGNKNKSDYLDWLETFLNNGNMF